MRMFLFAMALAASAASASCSNNPQPYWIQNWHDFDRCFHKDGWKVSTVYYRGNLREMCKPVSVAGSVAQVKR